MQQFNTGVVMQKNSSYTCCFFGHRKINETLELKNRLQTIVEELIIEHKVDTFLFGSKSEFDTLCHGVVSKLKEKYPYIKRIYVRAEYPYIDDNYKAYLLQSYDDTYYPEKIVKAGKAAYVERNCEMIDKSAYCVVYYDKNYTPPKRRGKKQLSEYQPKSGTSIAYDYASREGTMIINLFNVQEFM